MKQRLARWQMGLVFAAILAVVGVIGWRALQPAPVRSRATAGANPTHYEVELGPAPGLLDALKRSGQVPADAIDDGQGHFVSPSRLTPAQLEQARRLLRERETRRASRQRN